MIARPDGSCSSFKVVFVGNASTGKTSIIRRYYDNAFTSEVPPTIGSAYVTREVNTSNGPRLLQIWDTAGEERYRSLVPMYSRGAVVAVVVFDLSNRESFMDVEDWIQNVQVGETLQCRIVIAANKVDLPPVVPVCEIDKWASDGGWSLVYVSAQSGEGISGLFETIAALVPWSIERMPMADVIHIEETKQNVECC
jgi:small GTP-binding protein